MLKAFISKLINRKAAPLAYALPKSRKHIRITYRAHDVSIAYYGHDGRKVTRVNNIKFGALPAVIKSAAKLGYRKI